MLDVSSSMRGTPFTTMKEAAANFVSSCWHPLGTTGLPSWFGNLLIRSIRLKVTFSAVEQTIADIRLGGGTNTSEALTEAKNLMDTAAREDASKISSF